MLTISLGPIEAYDEANDRMIVYPKIDNVTLEHSLLALRKWESKWKKPFLTKDKKTLEEKLDYIKCMTITKGIDDIYFSYVSRDVQQKISEYIEDSMTATSFREDVKKKRGRSSSRIPTAELIYFKMFSYRIPKELEKWHLNSLTTLLKIFDEENSPKRNMSQKEIHAHNKATNAARKKKYNTKG